MIDEARQVGANLVTYILGTFQLGRFLSTTKVYHEAGGPQPRRFRVRPVLHDGDWDPDPSARVQPAEVRPRQLHAGSEVQTRERPAEGPQGGDVSAAVHHGTSRFRLERGGSGRHCRSISRPADCCLADACCGRLAFDVAFRREIAKVLPGSKLESLPADHPLYHCHYDIKQVEYTPRVREDFGQFEHAGAGRHHASTASWPSSTADSTWATAGNSFRMPTATA